MSESWLLGSTIAAHIIRWQCPDCATVHHDGSLPPGDRYTIATIPRDGIAAGALEGMGVTCGQCGWDADNPGDVKPSGWKA